MEDGSSALSAASSPPAPSSSGSSSTDLPTRIFVSLLACSIVSWQLLETAKLPSAAGEKRCCMMRGSPLQWWLLGLMLLSVIEGVLMTLADLVLLARRDPTGGLSAADMRQELSLTLAIGHADQLIVSLMIIGLGVSGCRSGVKHARVAVGLGMAALLSRRLPAPPLLAPYPNPIPIPNPNPIPIPNPNLNPDPNPNPNPGAAAPRPVPCTQPATQPATRGRPMPLRTAD
jgi:hypothetical protein